MSKTLWFYEWCLSSTYPGPSNSCIIRNCNNKRIFFSGTEGERNRPSWLHLEKEGHSILHSQWTLDYLLACIFSELWTMCLVAMDIAYLSQNRPPGLINTRFHTKISQCQKECNNLLCSQSLEKAMAPHSSTLAWKIPWREEPGGLQPLGSRRVRHDWATSLSLFTFMLWRRKWQATPVFLPGESQGRRSLAGCCLWGRTELDMTEAT